LQAACRYTQQLASTHYENFPVLTRFVPARLRQHFANVYAYCRWSDDLADEVAGHQQSLELLDWWQQQLEAAYRGRPQHPVMVALAETVKAFSIPQEPFLDLLTAFRRDQMQNRYATFANVCEYCDHSANPVGRLVLYLCERYSDERAALSDAVCTGLQLTNFWQDVANDAEKDRIYIPGEDLAHFGVSEAEILGRRFTAKFGRLLEFEVGRAREYLLAGLPLACEMRGRLRIVVAMFAHGGLAILRKIGSVGYNVLDSRPVLNKWDTCPIAARALLSAVGRSRKRQKRPAPQGVECAP
jgi:squalene synthase HpnC